MVRLRASRLEAPAPGPVRAVPDGVTDADLAARVQAGDGRAEEAIFRRYFDYISALSVRLLRDRAEGEDVVQDTFLDAFAQIRRGGSPDAMRAWLAGIAVHKAHRRFRRRKLASLLGFHQEFLGDVLMSTAHTGTSPELRTELGLLDGALAVLSDEDRAAWTLRFVEGYSLDEVAALSRCSLATAKRRIGRARLVVDAHVDVDVENAERSRSGVREARRAQGEDDV
jgi:RNA polymerase sigma-70 factor (ECF subfamily)